MSETDTELLRIAVVALGDIVLHKAYALADDREELRILALAFVQRAEIALTEIGVTLP